MQKSVVLERLKKNKNGVGFKAQKTKLSFFSEYSTEHSRIMTYRTILYCVKPSHVLWDIKHS